MTNRFRRAIKKTGRIPKEAARSVGEEGGRGQKRALMLIQ